MAVLNGNRKYQPTLEAIGCSVDELKLWLESQFQPGMTWDNYGEWHIDHIIPLASFDLSKRNHQKKACHWFNLRPLWKEQNLSREKRITYYG